MKNYDIHFSDEYKYCTAYFKVPKNCVLDSNYQCYFAKMHIECQIGIKVSCVRFHEHILFIMFPYGETQDIIECALLYNLFDSHNYKKLKIVLKSLKKLETKMLEAA